MKNQLIDCITPLLNSSMDRIWIKFNIFFATQIGVLISVIINFAKLEEYIYFKFVLFFLMLLFSFAGVISLFFGLDLQKALLKTLEEDEESKKLLNNINKHRKMSNFICSTFCIIIELIFLIFWIVFPFLKI